MAQELGNNHAMLPVMPKASPPVNPGKICGRLETTAVTLMGEHIQFTSTSSISSDGNSSSRRCCKC